MAIREEIVASAVSDAFHLLVLVIDNHGFISWLTVEFPGAMLVSTRLIDHFHLHSRNVNNEAVLQDPSVATSSVENKISFLRTKNLTQEEIDAAIARAGGGSGAVAPRAPYAGAPQGPPQGPPQQYYQSYPQYAWQPPASTQRDWRDWFIMATVVGGVSYGLYSLGKVKRTQRASFTAAILTRIIALCIPPRSATYP